MRGGDGLVANGLVADGAEAYSEERCRLLRRLVADGAIINYCDMNLVLCDTLPPRRRVWHVEACGFVSIWT